MRILDAKIPTEPEIGPIFLKLKFAIRDTRNLTSANYSKTFRNNSIDLRPTNVSSTGSPGPFSCRLTLKGLVKSSISIFQTWEMTGNELLPCWLKLYILKTTDLVMMIFAPELKKL